MKQQQWRWPWQPPPPPDPVRPPKVGGTRAPDNVRAIDFTRPHNFHFRFGYNRDVEVVFERCLIVGFTTPINDGAASGYEEVTHNRWIVLQYEDGRLAYVPRESLLYIEEPPSSNSAGNARQDHQNGNST